MPLLLKSPRLLSGAAGVLSFGIFLLALYANIGSTFLLFFPLFPVLCACFLLGNRALHLSLATALFALAASSDPYGAITYIIIVAIPAFIIGIGYNRRIKFGDTEIWAPEGRIIVHLMVFLFVLFIGSALYMSDTEGGLEGVITDGYNQALEQLPPEIKVKAAEVSSKMIYIAPVAMGATWLMMSCFVAWLSHFTLASYGLIRRKSFTFRHLDLPIWFLFASIGFALAAIFGGGEVQYVSRVCLALITFPYCYAGVLFVHESTRKWPNRFFILAFFYLLLFNLWSFALVAMLGVALHVKKVTGRNQL